MYELKLTKKDFISINQQVGEKGEFSNESSLDFALNSAQRKKNWLFELSYFVRSLLVDHVFQDGNKRTGLVIIIFYLEENKKIYVREKLLPIITHIAKKNINNPSLIAGLIYNVIREENLRIGK